MSGAVTQAAAGRIVVFSGPTLSPAEGRAHLDAEYLPPAAQGDVYRVARRRPRAIGIVDGYFDTLPAIWHKEILWAIHEGIPVFGSASMGALRAAELAAFGMHGVGAIFAAFHDGTLEDDDEVALAHEPAANGYRALSVPMVNIRATLAAAVEASILTTSARDLLLERGKRLFYPERTYRRLVAEGSAAGLRAEMDALARWLVGHEVDLKRADAIAMLGAMKAHVARGPESDSAPRFHFEHTTFWDGLRQSCDELADPAPDAAAQQGTMSAWRDVVDEARLREGSWALLRARALNRALARAHGEREGQRVPSERLARAAEDFRRERGLLDEGSLAAWLRAHDLDDVTLARLLEDEALLGWAGGAAEIERRVLDEMRTTEDYVALRDRALAKQSALAQAGLTEPAPADAGMTRDELLAWYAREVNPGRAGGCGHETRDVAALARDVGFTDEQLFLRIVLRELLFRRLETERSR